MDHDETWYVGKLRPRPHCVQILNGDPAPPKRGAAPHFRPMSVVAKELDGLRCHLVYGGRPRPRPHCYVRIQLPSQKGDTAASQFSAHVLWSNGWMDQGATLYRGRIWLSPHCGRWGPSPFSDCEGCTATYQKHFFINIFIFLKNFKNSC